MGLFNWLFGSRARPVQFHAELPGPGDFDVDVVETSKYQAAIERAAGGHGEKSIEVSVNALLFFENDNPHDEDAVKSSSIENLSAI